MGAEGDEPGLRFGRWRLLPGQRRLLLGGAPVPLGSRALDLLIALVEARGELVTKDALLRRVWPGTVVEENNLQVQVSALRKALGEDAARLIVTIPGRGYRFAGASDAALPHDSPPVPAPVAERPALAVMPFRNLSGDAEQEYFADGIAEDLTTALSHLRWFSVIARNSAFTYKGRAVDVRQIGRELGVDYVLEGSVRKAGGQVRIAAQLCEAATGHQVWGERFDGDLADIFALQDRVTEAVAGAVEPSLRSAEVERARAKPTEVRCAREVIAEPGADDPTALAWAAHALTSVGREYEAGLAAAHRALRLAPDSGQVLALGAWSHLYVDDWRPAVAQTERAMRLSPVDPSMFLFMTTLSAAFFVGGQYEAAADWARRAIRDRPGYLAAHRLLATSLARLGRLDEARGSIPGLLPAAPGYTVGAAAAHSAFRGRTRERYLDGLRRAGLPD